MIPPAESDARIITIELARLVRYYLAMHLTGVLSGLTVVFLTRGLRKFFRRKKEYCTTHTEAGFKWLEARFRDSSAMRDDAARYIGMDTSALNEANANSLHRK